MKNKMYVNGMGSISAQENEGVFKGSVIEFDRNIFHAIDPEYRNFLLPIALRRMSKGVKMGIAAAKMALQESGNSQPDAIITGTGQGCKQDTEKFLEDMLDQDEKLLSPTSFIQSTHNTVGGQIALQLKCTSYNVTYTQNSASLESALIDAGLLFEETNEDLTVLAGGVDEISPEITSFSYLDGQLKQEEILNTHLYESGTPGSITSEGAHFFALSNKKTLQSYSEIVDVSLFNTNYPGEVLTNILNVLNHNRLTPDEIDLVILGNNGDSRYDQYYIDLQKGLFKNSTQLCYKHLVGEYNTVSGYALWLGSRILKNRVVPENFRVNKIQAKKLQNILIYNHYLGENHSIILLCAP